MQTDEQEEIEKMLSAINKILLREQKIRVKEYKKILSKYTTIEQFLLNTNIGHSKYTKITSAFNNTEPKKLIANIKINIGKIAEEEVFNEFRKIYNEIKNK